jgi:hypothetical protein
VQASRGRRPTGRGSVGPEPPLAANAPAGLSVREAAVLWGLSKSTAARRLTSGAASPQVNPQSLE